MLELSPTTSLCFRNRSAHLLEFLEPLTGKETVCHRYQDHRRRLQWICKRPEPPLLLEPARPFFVPVQGRSQSSLGCQHSKRRSAVCWRNRTREHHEATGVQVLWALAPTPIRKDDHRQKNTSVSQNRACVATFPSFCWPRQLLPNLLQLGSFSSMSKRGTGAAKSLRFHESAKEARQAIRRLV